MEGGDPRRAPRRGGVHENNEKWWKAFARKKWKDETRNEHWALHHYHLRNPPTRGPVCIHAPVDATLERRSRTRDTLVWV